MIINDNFISKLTTRENSVSLPVVSSGVATRNSSDFNTKISVIVELDLVILIGHCCVRNGGFLVGINTLFILPLFLVVQREHLRVGWALHHPLTGGTGNVPGRALRHFRLRKDDHQTHGV